jgi:drug/metabolite transporter (DMT)-like permease
MARTTSATLSAILCMAGGAAAFATMAALIKVACVGIPIFEVVAVRGALGWLLLAGWELARTGRLRRGVDRPRLFLRSLFGFGGIATYVWAIAHIDLGVASALNQSSPVFVAVLSFLFLRERPPLAVPLLVVVAFAGVWLIVAPDLRAVDWNALVGVASGLSAAVAYVLVRTLRRTDPPLVIIRWFSAWCLILSLPTMWVEPWAVPDTPQTLALGGAALFALVGQLGITWAYRLAEASLVSPFLYVSVLGSLAWGWFVWGEWPGALASLGIALVVGSSLLVGWLGGRRAAPRRAARGGPT